MTLSPVWQPSMRYQDETVLYWVDQKVCSGFSITSYGKTQMTFLAKPIILISSPLNIAVGNLVSSVSQIGFTKLNTLLVC